MKKMMSILLMLTMISALTTPASAVSFSDIPSDGVLAGEVYKAVDYGLMNGYNATTFGYFNSMTRAQFTAVLVRMMGWELITPETPTCIDVPKTHYWYSVLETAAAHGVCDYDYQSDGRRFRPGDPITRAEMSKLLVQALGLENAALGLNSNRMIPFSDLNHHTPFQDLPDGNEGYISVAYTIGMTKGTTATTFSPNATATRAQAAAMLVRMYEKMYRDTDFVHGFYAISSRSQLGLAENMNAVSAGWSRMLWDGEKALLSTTSANGNEFCIPSGYQEVTSALQRKHVPLNLSVYMDATNGLNGLLASEAGRRAAVSQIVNELTVTYKTIGKNPYSGVTIDFEGVTSANRGTFVQFLQELSAQMTAIPDKTHALYVCVQPVPTPSTVYQNGYDYKAIGTLADKVILMAHDYDPRNLDSYVNGPGDTGSYHQHCPTVPLDRIYLDLRNMTELVDSSKVVLAFSARNIAWKIDANGKLLSGTPVSVAADTVAKRLAQSDTVTGWSPDYQQSWVIYTTEDGSHYFLWYQDEQSVQLELNTAKLLGVTGVSLWRLGTIPQHNTSSFNWSCLIE